MNGEAPVPAIETALTRHTGSRVPIICGPMYPCSNPELVATVSAAGGLGVVQPVSLTYVHGYDFRKGLQRINRLSGGNPIGMNALIEQSSRRYRRQMEEWVDIALEEGVRFFITSLGKPGWVARRVHAAGGVVYHDVTERKWAVKGLDEGADGLIAVNNRAGGHAGGKSREALLDELRDFSVPVVCAGGISTADEFVSVLDQGFAGVQMGTRFIATVECHAGDAYKQAILQAGEQDIVLSERITGVPVSVIRTPYIEKTGIKAGSLARWMLSGNRTRHMMRTLYALKALYQLRQAHGGQNGAREYWQAGKSVAGIREVETVSAVISRFAHAVSRE